MELVNLRHKESDRIKSVETNLNKIGIKTKSTNSSLTIFGNPKIKIKNTLKVSTNDDHRVAMAFFCLAEVLDGKV